MDPVTRWDAAALAAAGGADAPVLPQETPLAMPEQSLRKKSARSGKPPTSPHGVSWRRAVLLCATLGLTGFAGYEMYLVLKVGGLTNLEAVILALYVMLLAWIAFSFATAVAGFFALAVGGRASALDIDAKGPLPRLSARIALLVPTYNESPPHLIARIEAIYESLDKCDALSRCDFFLLSDTTDPDVWIAEELQFLALRNRTGGHERIFYRHRATNEGRKAGNIADWVKKFGGRYQHMIVLDADSLMTGSTIVRLVAAMERNPRVGLIQTLPIIVNANSLFARAQQFAGRLYGPLIAHGLSWWHGAEGNYWGHNAAIRVRAFAEHAGLPVLRGRKPFGGNILSHDFVEAAMLRRAGWAIHMAPALPGSYEECPPSLTEYALRDRRWCQGNLQHLGVLPARGFHWVSRLHLITGIGAYVTAPLWLVFLVVGILISLEARFVPPEYFPSGFSLFPQWPSQDPVRAAQVFAGTFGLLLAPKLLGYLAALQDHALRRGCGGALRAFLGLLIETLVSGLAAPILMLMQTAAVLQILLGRDAGWSAQRRDDGGLPLRDTWRRYRWHTIFGLLFAAAAYAVSPPLFLWMAPVVVGLAFAVPLAVATASAGWGLGLRRLGLLAIPEEADPPLVLARARELLALLQRDERTREQIFAFFLDSPELVELHRRMLPKAPRRSARDLDVHLAVGLAKLDESENLDEALEALSEAEKRALLGSERGIERLAALRRAQNDRAA
jgi:membrane glycosyltransferase